MTSAVPTDTASAPNAGVGGDGDGSLEFAAEYERRAAVPAEPGLPRLRRFLDLLGNPQGSFPSIVVAGSVGKSSTVDMITDLLQAFGIRVGSLTSPDWLGPKRRIILAGEAITSDALGRAFDDIAPYLPLIEDDGELSAFELLAVVAFAAFADAPVDLAVIESGSPAGNDLDGLLDAPVTVITPTVLDGPVPAGILGAIRPESLIVLAQQGLPAAEALLRRASGAGATVAREGLEFGVVSRLVAVGGQMIALKGLGGEYDDLFLPLYGAHQAHNAAVALAAVEAFLGGGQNQLDVEAIRAGLARVNTSGRLEVVRRSPTIVLDLADSAPAAAAVASALEEAFTFDTLVGVLGVEAPAVGTSDGGEQTAADLLAALEPVLNTVVITQGGPAALSVDDLAAVAVDIFGSDRVEVEARLDDALDTAVRLAEEEGELGGAGVVITGSPDLVGRARALLRR